MFLGTATIILLAAWRTSSQGVEIQKIELQIDLEKERTEQTKEETKQLRIAAKEKQQPAFVPPPVLPAAPATTVPAECISLNDLKDRRLHGIRKDVGCLQRRSIPSVVERGIYLQFDEAPTSIEGIVQFSDLIRDEHGVVQGTRSQCSTGAAPDRCIGYLRNTLGIELWVAQHGHMKINFD
jgi:hypothetical protein